MVLSALWSGRAVAEIHDYMILRLLYLHSSCGTLSLEPQIYGIEYTVRGDVPGRDLIP